jgi:DNA recombination protein RmuC
MLAGIGIGLLAGAVVGWLIARMSGLGSLRTENIRTEQLTMLLAQRESELEVARRAHEGAIREQAESREREGGQREEIARLTADSGHLQHRVQSLESDCVGHESLKERLRSEIGGLTSKIAQLTVTVEADKKHADEKLALLTAARVELANQFETLANRILEEKSKRFTEQNQENLGNLLNPLKEKFGEFQQKVESLEKDGVAGRSELKEQIGQLRSLNERLSQDATNLVTALRGSSKRQGDWGEFVLESILESSGLRKGHEYRMQESITREDRTRARLDVIVDLPEGRHLVIDAKVSLNDYNDHCAAEEEALRESSLKQHVASMRTHIRELSQRNYHALYQLNSLDFVVMFVPIEPAFMLAIAHDGKLWQEAWDKNVLLVSPSTLLFVLRTVSQLWRQEQQTKNVQEIVRRGGDLYDKLAAFAKDLTDVGRNLDAARGAYEEAYKKLASGKGNAVRQAEMLKSLGVKPSKSMPRELIERALEDYPLELAAGAEEQPSLLNDSHPVE